LANRSRLTDPEFRAKLEIAFRARSDGHLSVRAAAKVAAIPWQTLRRWERRLRSDSAAQIEPPVATPRAEALRRARLARSAAAHEARRKRSMESSRCCILQCSACLARVMFDGTDRFDVVALPYGGWVALAHHC
jgi:hypothetical protein